MNEEKKKPKIESFDNIEQIRDYYFNTMKTSDRIWFFFFLALLIFIGYVIVRLLLG